MAIKSRAIFSMDDEKIYKKFNQSLYILNEKSDETMYENKKTQYFEDFYLKNFCLELNFYNIFWDSALHPTPTIIYVGDFVDHLFAISKFYPWFNFIVYSNNNEKLKKAINNTEEKNKFTFLLEESFDPNKYLNGEYFFLTTFLRDEENEEKYYDLMMKQKEWVEIINPIASLIFFRPPKTYQFQGKSEGWQSGKMNFLNGTVFFPIYGEKKTTRTRIAILKDSGTIVWDIKKYELQCNFFNQVTRDSQYYNPITGYITSILVKYEMHNNFDETALVSILIDYFSKFNEKVNEKIIQLTIVRILKFKKFETDFNYKILD